MLIFSIAFATMLTGYEAYINACSSSDGDKKICKCQADFLSLQISDDKILELTIASSMAMQGRDDRLRDMAEKNPDIVVAIEKLEKQALACEGY
jgi:hypothetical protein